MNILTFDNMISIFLIFLFSAVGIWMTFKAKNTVNKTAVYFMAMGILCFALGDIYFILHSAWIFVVFFRFRRSMD